MTLSIAPPPSDVSPALAAKREELGILHEIFGALSSGNIRASEWQKAQKILGYLDSKIQAVQKDADALTPAAEVPAAAPAIPDLAAPVAH